MAEIDIPELKLVMAELRTIRQMLEGATVTPAPQWMTIAEACSALGVSRATVHRKIASGELEAKGSGKTRMVRLNQAA